MFNGKSMLKEQLIVDLPIGCFQGRFKYQPGQVRAFGMLAGGTGITPMFQVFYFRIYELSYFG